MAEIQFDNYSWTRDENNDIMPLLPPKPRNYPAEPDVAFPVVYGEDNQYVGELIAGAPPVQPTLTVEDLGSGIARFTISGSTPTSSNAVYVRVATGIVWGASPVVTIIGDGSANATLDPGPYLARVRSSLLLAVSPASNEPVLFFLQDPDAGYTRSKLGEDFLEGVMPSMLTEFGEPLTYLRGVESVELVGIQGDIITANDAATGIDVSVGDASWEVLADDLDFGSGPIVPKAQDQIISSTGEIFVVVESGLLDSEQIMWTIPVKRSEYKELP